MVLDINLLRVCVKEEMILKRRYNPYSLPPWLKKVRGVGEQFILPFCIFQGIRTLIFPTAFDVLFLIVLILLAVAFKMQLI